MAAHSFSSPPGLTVTGARWKRTGTLAGNTGLQRRAGVARNAGPQVSDRIPVPVEVGVAHRDQVPEPVDWCSGECPGTHSGDVSRVYATRRKILLSFSVLAGDSRYLLSASECCPVRFKEVYVAAPRFAGWPPIASLQFMRARGSAPQRETGTATASRPGTHAPAAPAGRDEPHDHNGHPARHSGSGPDAWIRELVEAAPPLTPAQRHALALLLNSPRPAHARPAGAAVPGQRA